MKILVADDDPNLKKILARELGEAGFDVQEADSGTKALDLLEGDGYDVLLLDLNMPDLDGLQVLKRIKSSEIPTEVVILTGHGAVSTAVEAMKLGAHDYLTKPFKMEELRIALEKAYEKRELVRENLHLKTQIRRQSETRRMVGKNPVFLDILEQAKKMALTGFPVLICGETGVGKELIAKVVHDCSKRREGPFIPINCGAIAENMLESELFGHEKGAFTGAYARKSGLLEVADHGTLFLDEVAELTLQLQGKILRAIETGVFFRVGGVKEVRVDVRFVSATNRDIKTEVEKGRFREDLYYRISGLTLFIPPLRERKEDIPLLIEETVNHHPAFRDKRFGPEAQKILSKYAWPGNVRELQNVVHRTALLSKADVIEPSDLPGDLLSESRTGGKRLEDMEREHILKVLEEVGGQRGKAAEILGVDPKTLYRKLLSYGVKE